MNEVELTGVNLEDEPILPDGYTEGDDFFSPDSWGGSHSADGQIEEQETNEGTTEAEEEVPATDNESSDAETPAAAEQQPEQQEEDVQPTETETARKLKFRAKIDHNEQDIELDESDLPNLYEKAQALDRTRERYKSQSGLIEKATKLAKQLGYENVETMLTEQYDHTRTSEIQKLVEAGVPERYASMMVDQANTVESAPQPEQQQGDKLRDDVKDFVSKYGTAEVPPEVVREAAATGQPLVKVYETYQSNHKVEAAKAVNADLQKQNKVLAKENRVLKQNATAAAKAPVKGVSGGGSTNQSAEDPFVKGFDSYAW